MHYYAYTCAVLTLGDVDVGHGATMSRPEKIYGEVYDFAVPSYLCGRAFCDAVEFGVGRRRGYGGVF